MAEGQGSCAARRPTKSRLSCWRRLSLESVWLATSATMAALARFWLSQAVAASLRPIVVGSEASYLRVRSMSAGVTSSSRLAEAFASVFAPLHSPRKCFRFRGLEAGSMATLIQHTSPCLNAITVPGSSIAMVVAYAGSHWSLSKKEKRYSSRLAADIFNN